MRKTKIAFLMALVAAGVSGRYLLTRHPIAPHAVAGATVPRADATSAADDRTKAGDRNDRPANKPKRKSYDGKLKATLPPDLTPDQATKLLADFLAKNPDVRQQKRYAIALMEKLCDNGCSEEAWSLIPRDRGELKEDMTESYFSYADLPSARLLAKLALEGPDTGSGIKGYLRQFSPADLPGIVSSEGLRDLLKNVSKEDMRRVHMDSWIRDALFKNLGQGANSDFVITTTAAEMNAKGQLGSLEFLEVMAHDKTTSPFDKWEKMRAIDISSFRDDVEKEESASHRAAFLSAMIIENAPETLDLMLKSGSSDKDRDLADAIRSWIDVHSSEPSSWFVNNRGRMSLQQQALAVDVFVNKALNAGEFEGARLWVKEIPDEARRAKTLEAIDAKEAEKHKPRAGNQQEFSK